MLKINSFNHFGDEAVRQISEVFGEVVIVYIKALEPSDIRDSPRIDKFLLSKKKKKNLYFGWYKRTTPINLFGDYRYSVSITLVTAGCGIVGACCLPTEYFDGYMHEKKEGRICRGDIEVFTSEQINKLFVPVFEILKQPQLF